MTTRKSFIKSAIAGPALLSMAPYLYAGANKTQSPKRFIFVRFSNGMLPDKLAMKNLPANLALKEKRREAYELDLDKYELPEYLEGMNDYKENMCVLQGMSSKMADNGHTAWHSVLGLFRSSGKGNLSGLKRVTIDYELAKLFPSPLGHVELSFADDRHGIVPGYGVPAPYQQNYCYADPITAYNKLFQCVLDPQSMKIDNNMLVNAHEDSALIARLKKGADKNAYENNARSVERIQARNKKLMKMASKVAKYMPDKDMVYSQGKKTDSYVKRQEAMTEIAASVLTSGLTNVLTYTIDTLDTRQSGLPGLENLAINAHAVGHSGSFGGLTSPQIRAVMRKQHLKQIKTLIERLKAQPEGNGNMFDNTTIMYFPEGGEKHHSLGQESPWVVFSGKNCNLDMSGRYIRMPYHATQGHQTLGNWYTTLLNAHGNDIKHYGDLDPKMSQLKFPQKGAIKRFLKV